MLYNCIKLNVVFNFLRWILHFLSRGAFMFSEKFNVSKDIISSYGTIDISLISDIPMFIDPILIFNSEKKEYKLLHEKMIKYMHFLAIKSKTNLSKSEIKTWFSFNEVCNNWLGYSISGNKGLALDTKFAEF